METNHGTDGAFELWRKIYFRFGCFFGFCRTTHTQHGIDSFVFVFVFNNSAHSVAGNSQRAKRNCYSLTAVLRIMNVKYVQRWQLILDVFFFFGSLSFIFGKWDYVLFFQRSQISSCSISAIMFNFGATTANKYFTSFCDGCLIKFEAIFLAHIYELPSFSSLCHWIYFHCTSFILVSICFLLFYRNTH